MGWHFVVVSAAGTNDRLVFEGDGVVESDGVQGGGSFVHFDASKSPGSNVVASGTWRATQLVSFVPVPDPTGKGGSVAAGDLIMKVQLLRELPSPAIINATADMVCSLGFADLHVPGKAEGVTVAVPGTPFAEMGTPGPFKPIVPPFGVTVFTQNVAENED